MSRNALTLKSVLSYDLPPGSIALWWLGQASYLVKSPQGVVAALDPYLTNSCKSIGEAVGLNMDRQVAPPLAPEDLAGIHWYVLTHSHGDHLDPETLAGYRTAGGHGPYVAPAEAAEKLKFLGVPSNEIEIVWPNRSVTVQDLTLRATFAIPFGGDDLTHVGYLFSVANGPTVYFTGDTGYHEVLAESVAAHHPDVMVTVINGAFRNLSPSEAATLAGRIDPQVIIPCHYDLFPDNSMPPGMLLTNLKTLGLGDRYRELVHGMPYLFTRGPGTGK